MNLTVSLGTTQQRLHPSTQDAVIGIVQLQQPPDGSLFVIGDIRQQMQMGLASFNNMALQPVTPPISNREYEFRCERMPCVSDWGSVHEEGHLFDSQHSWAGPAVACERWGRKGRGVRQERQMMQECPSSQTEFKTSTCFRALLLP
jgi:hypothetical protein